MEPIYVSFGRTFPVPAAVADHLLKLASHDQLKVLLYVLCHAGEPLSAAQIAAACSVQTDAVSDALIWWQDANVLSGIVPAPPAVKLTDAVSAPAVTQEPAAAPLRPAAAQSDSSSLSAITPTELAEHVKQSGTLRELFDSIQQVTGKLPTFTEQRSLLWMYEYLGLPAEVILTLVAYCVKAGKHNAKYVEQVASEWHARGINTLAGAEEDVQRRLNNASFTGQIMSIFQMSRTPTAKQQAYIDGWESLRIPLELIRFAYEYTRDQKDDKVIFPYIDKILRRWHAAGIHTAAAAQEEIDAHAAAYRAQRSGGKRSAQTAPGNAPSSSIDLAEVEKLMNNF